MLDNRPQYLASLEENADNTSVHYKTKNYLGIAACTKHNENIDKAGLMSDRHYHKDTRKPSSSAGVAIAVIIVIIMILGTAIYIFMQHRKRNKDTASKIAS